MPASMSKIIKNTNQYNAFPSTTDLFQPFLFCHCLESLKTISRIMVYYTKSEFLTKQESICVALFCNIQAKNLWKFKSSQPLLKTYWFLLKENVYQVQSPWLLALLNVLVQKYKVSNVQYSNQPYPPATYIFSFTTVAVWWHLAMFKDATVSHWSVYSLYRSTDERTPSCLFQPPKSFFFNLFIFLIVTWRNQAFLTR